MQSLIRQVSRARWTQRQSWAVARTSQSFRTIVTKRFTADHELVAYDDATGVGVVTITNHAQQALGDVVFVELPTIGTTITQGGRPAGLCLDVVVTLSTRPDRSSRKC
ncbi:hypothetical protein AX16_009573 [Volvariella volvacea WC 439]|nr:hypothetical protein AX16_009573 [Volvariella volvacea WC 439]